MKHIIKSLTFSTLCAASLFLCSCDTDVEPVDINQPGIEQQNAELYQNYLTKLKAYKASRHKIMMHGSTTARPFLSPKASTSMPCPTAWTTSC